jgi:hypothetical protein
MWGFSDQGGFARGGPIFSTFAGSGAAGDDRWGSAGWGRVLGWGGDAGAADGGACAGANGELAEWEGDHRNGSTEAHPAAEIGDAELDECRWVMLYEKESAEETGALELAYRAGRLTGGFHPRPNTPSDAARLCRRRRIDFALAPFAAGYQL